MRLTPNHPRMLWVHAGGHKTGSTAIQNYLTLGGLQTTAPHIYYRRIGGVDDPSHMNIGNGQVLLPLPPSRELGPALENFLGDTREALVSSENLSYLSSEEWQRLDETAASRGIRVQAVFFIRDALPFMVSLYDQLIKSGLTHEEFASWAKTAEWIHVHVLRRLTEVFPPERLRVRHYDSEKHRLLQAFFQAMGIPDPQLAPLAGEIGILNRSLTHRERNLLRWINRNHPSPFFQELLNAGLQRAHPAARPEAPEIPAELSKALLGKFGGEIEWINRTFFGARPVVGFGTVADWAARESSSDKEAAQNLAVFQTALRIVMERADLHAQILHRIKTLDREKLTDPRLPRDFDPVGYLVRNPDLIRSDIPVIEHFLQHGQKEGRQY